MKQILFLLGCLLTSACFNAQIVNIPDANFKNYLVNNLSVNSNNDSEIQVSEANVFTGTLFAENKNISDLTGIEEFLNLTILHCYSNNISSLNVSNCSKLIELNCGDNPLTSLNVSGCDSLKNLFARFSMLSSINLLNNTKLSLLYLEDNQLSSLDLSGNPNLVLFDASNNQITTLNIVNSTNLQTIGITKNLITSLDLSNHSDLYLIEVDSNNLSVLNIQNGTNSSLLSYKSLGNPNLACIQVDDVAYANANFTNVDAWSSFSTNCFVGINETNNSVITNIYPNPTTNLLYIETTQANLTYQLINVTGETITQASLKKEKNHVKVENIPNGVYFLTVYNQQSIVATQKLIIAH